MRVLKTVAACGILAVIAAALPRPAFADFPHPEVLVVYNSNFPDSLAVANHYMIQRSVPASNLCVITPPSNDYLTLDDYTTYVKAPIQDCLTALGPGKILYIVMSYMTPFRVLDGPMGIAAIDSYLADIWDKYVSQPLLVVPNATQPYYADSQSQGNAYAPFQSFAAYRANPRNPVIYSVWRMDAPTAAIASALVDQAIAAESQGGPFGQACIDELVNAPDFPDESYRAADWDLFRASEFLSSAGLTVLTDTLSSEFGTPPSPLCPNTAFYSGWYSLETYNDAFAWQAGSVGWHLDSASATSPRSGPNWTANALARGIAVTTGSVYEPYLQGLVRPAGTYRNLLEGANVGDAFLRNTRWLKWEIIYVGDPLYRPFGNGLPPFSPLQPVDSFMLSPQEIVGGTNSTGIITLSSPAPADGTTFTLSAGADVSVPATVTVPGGETQVSFPILTSLVTASQAIVINATAGTLTLQNTILIDPLLGALIPSSKSIKGGNAVNVAVILNGRAPAGGATVNLSSDTAALTVPPAITVPAGSMTATFKAMSTPVGSTVPANVRATYAGAAVITSITVVPAA